MSGHLNLDILFAGDPQLVNVYSVIRVVGSHGSETARVLWTWLTSESGRRRIDGFRASDGQALFRTLLVGDGLPFATWSKDRLATEETGRSRSDEPLISTGSLYLPDSNGSWGLLEELLRRLACRSVPPSQTGAACGRATAMEVSATRGLGLEPWLRWIEQERAARAVVGSRAHSDEPAGVVGERPSVAHPW